MSLPDPRGPVAPTGSALPHSTPEQPGRSVRRRAGDGAPLGAPGHRAARRGRHPPRPRRRAGHVAALAARRHPARLLGEQDVPRPRRGVRRGRGRCWPATSASSTSSPRRPAPPAPAPRAITVEHCLRMSTGHHTDTLDAVRGLAAAARSRRPSSSPPSPRRSPARGSCTTTGPAGCWPWPCSGAPAQRLVDYLRPRLLDPLGVPEAAWTTWAGSDLGFSGLHVSTDTVARLGLLLLQDGMWQGRRLLPAGWVAHGVEPPGRHHPPPRQRRLDGRLRLPDVAQRDTAASVPTAPTASSPSCCPSTTSSSPSPGAPTTPRRCSTPCGTSCSPTWSTPPSRPTREAHARLVAALDTAAATASGSTSPPPPTPAPWSLTHAPGRRAPRAAVGRGPPRRAGLGARGRRRRAAHHPLRRRPLAGCRGLTLASPAAAGWPRACSRRRSSPCRPRTRCCCAALTVR